MGRPAGAPIYRLTARQIAEMRRWLYRRMMLEIYHGSMDNARKAYELLGAGGDSLSDFLTDWAGWGGDKGDNGVPDGAGDGARFCRSDPGE